MRLGLAAAAWLIAALPAHAQHQAAPPTAEAGGRVLLFGPEFFAEANPADALDMVLRLPGFTLVEGDEEVRGFDEARGNVLFDGKAPSTKDESLEDLLRRTPASSVERIELIRGSAPGIDMGGHAVVANIVRKRVALRQGAAEAGAAMASDGVVRPNLRFEASRQSGEQRLQGTLALKTEIDEESGDGALVVRNPLGATLESQARREWEVIRTLSASGEYEAPLAGGEFSANASLSREQTGERVDVQLLSPDSGIQRARERETLDSAELGSRYRHELGSSHRIEALFLHRLSRLDALSTEEEEDGAERFAENTDQSETIARLTVRGERAALELEAAVEGALNRLESDATLEEDGEVVPLPGSDAAVEERRANASLGAVWRPNRRVTLEPSLGLEFSTIESTGDAPQRRSFTYLKPRLAASFALEANDQLRFAVERSVSQLDFADFVASASLDRDDVTAGAVSLRPPASWSASLTYEHRFWEEGALVLGYTREWIDNVIDRVAVTVDEEIFDAVGNIGSGTRAKGTVELSLPLDRLGLDGTLLRGSATFLRSRVTDPVTGERRIITADKPIEGEINLSQDLMQGRLSWGVDAELAEREYEFRFDEIRKETEALRLGIWVEYRPAPAWRLRLQASNSTSSALRDRREKFDGPRSAGALEEIERRRIDTTPVVLFTLRRSFGGAPAQAGSEP